MLQQRCALIPTDTAFATDVNVIGFPVVPEIALVGCLSLSKNDPRNWHEKTLRVSSVDRLTC